MPALRSIILKSNFNRGIDQLVDRHAHTVEANGSSPFPATNQSL